MWCEVESERGCRRGEKKRALLFSLFSSLAIERQTYTCVQTGVWGVQTRTKQNNARAFRLKSDGGGGRKRAWSVFSRTPVAFFRDSSPDRTALRVSSGSVTPSFACSEPPRYAPGHGRVCARRGAGVSLPRPRSIRMWCPAAVTPASPVAARPVQTVRRWPVTALHPCAPACAAPIHALPGATRALADR